MTNSGFLWRNLRSWYQPEEKPYLSQCYQLSKKEKTDHIYPINMFLIWSFWLLFRRLNGLVTHCLCWNATGCKIKIQWDIRCSFENCEKMLSRWKSQYVSRVDRLTLINECSMLSQPTCCLYSPFLLELFKDRIELEDLTSSKATRSKEISTLLSGKNWSRGKKKNSRNRCKKSEEPR